MKSRSSSPQTSPQVVRRFWFDTSSNSSSNNNSSSKTESVTTGSPRKTSLRIAQLPPVSMSSFEPFSPSSATRDISPRPGLLAPVPNGVRRVTGDTATPLTNGHVPSAVSPPILESEPAEGPQWSAIGHATTAGKSGRIIEKLMAEKDKLTRALKEAELKAQAWHDELATYKPRMEALRQENANLNHTSSVDANMLSRRERKIEELKADLAAKNDRVHKAEALVRQQQRQMEEQQQQHTREHQSMMEQTKHATTSAEILETSHKQLHAEYRARRETWEHELKQLLEDREQDRQRMAKLDVVHEQMRLENERQRKANAEQLARWGQMEQTMRSKIDEQEAENERVRRKGAEMDDVVNQMRWVMGLQRSRAEAAPQKN